MTENAVPIADALAAELARRARPDALPRADLIRTGQALVTIRNPDGYHLVYRLRKRERGDGYWLDCRAGHSWTAVGIATSVGTLRDTVNGTDDRAIRYGARILLRALTDGARAITTDAGRVYTLHVEDRCSRCGEELTDPLSIEDGIGPVCYERANGRKRPTAKQRASA